MIDPTLNQANQTENLSRLTEVFSGVSVLLSTYNGNAHIREFLDSLCEQSFSRFNLIVRDDGSNDNTLNILESYRDRLYGLSVVKGRNIGACPSFFELLRLAPADHAVLLADQDDVWYQDKIARALCVLAQRDPTTPVLYCSRINLMDKDQQPVGTSIHWPRPPAFENALVENIVTGCTAALNPAAIMLVQSRERPQSAIMHDWWLYVLVSAFGDVVYDPEPSLAYRLHQENTVGLPRDRWRWFFEKIARLLKRGSLPPIARQAEEFHGLYKDQLSEDQLATLNILLSTRTLRGRLGFIFERTLYRQFSYDTIALKLLMAIRGGGL